MNSRRIPERSAPKIAERVRTPMGRGAKRVNASDLGEMRRKHVVIRKHPSDEWIGAKSSDDRRDCAFQVLGLGDVISSHFGPLLPELNRKRKTCP